MISAKEMNSTHPVFSVRDSSIRKQSVLFVCSNNAALSQIGAALLRYFDPTGLRFDVYSAASDARPAREIHPLASAMIEELGQDSRKLATARLEDYQDHYFDYVIIVNDQTAHAIQTGQQKLPKAGRVITWAFPDPTILPWHMQPHSFRQIGDSMYDLIRCMIKLPRFSGAPATEAYAQF